MSEPGPVHTVYTKTAKGHEAIATRSHGLVGRLRSLLILVDGKRPQSALHALAGGFGDVAAMLTELQDKGFITTPQAQAALAPAPAPVQTPPQTAAPAALTLPQAKAFATRQLMQIVGPTSDVLCLRIEAARNRTEFIEAIQRAYTVVADIRGRTQADTFGALIEANLPPA